MKSKILLIVIIFIASFLRLWKLDKVPVSLFGDELDVGYHAYSILKTGKDYYGNSWPIHFHSIAEWRTPLYLYSAVPTVALFGISPYGVRLPAAIFGILGVFAIYLFIKAAMTNEKLALVASGVLALSPWHIQYSRAGFEVTLLLLLLILGLWLFFKSIAEPKWLWLSTICFGLTPWVYSTAKLFAPLLLLFLTIVWRKVIFAFPRKYLLVALFSLILVSAPITYDTFLGKATQRFSYISIFTDPTMETEVGVARGVDAYSRGERGTGLNPSLLDRVTHNKFTFAGSNFLKNYLQPFSFDFLFNTGDTNPRHSIHNMGEFYKIDALFLVLGLILFFSSKTQDSKVKTLIAFWILAGVIPAALTRDGGNHATRLILILPPLVFLISFGITGGLNLFTKKTRIVPAVLYTLLFGMCFYFYQHNYWIHNPTYSERWWHSGWRESITSIKEIDSNYDYVVISMAGEPAWIFFAGNYMFPPDQWQKNFPIGNDATLTGFGKMSHIDKFYFGSPEGGVYDWGKVLNTKTLYLANAKEVGPNLIAEPDRTPGDLTLIKSIPYPSGEPAFYIFSGKK